MMKYLFLIMFSMTIGSTFASETSESLINAETSGVDSTKYGISFDTRMIELGKIKRGDKASGIFNLTNTGSEDIVIEFVSSCDCTTVDHSYSPIKPGASSKIEFVFDSAKKEKSGTTDIDIYLKNIDPKSGEPIFEILQYSYELIE